VSRNISGKVNKHQSITGEGEHQNKAIGHVKKKGGSITLRTGGREKTPRDCSSYHSTLTRVILGGKVQIEESVGGNGEGTCRQFREGGEGSEYIPKEKQKSLSLDQSKPGGKREARNEGTTRSRMTVTRGRSKSDIYRPKVSEQQGRRRDKGGTGSD